MAVATPTKPDEPTAGHEEGPGRADELRPRIDEDPEPRPEEPAGRGPDDRRRREREEDAEEVDRDRPDVEDVRNHASAEG